MAILNNMLKGHLIMSSHLSDIQVQKGCVFSRHPVYLFCLQESTEFKKQFDSYLTTRNKEATDGPSSSHQTIEEQTGQKTRHDLISVKGTVLTTKVIKLEE